MKILRHSQISTTMNTYTHVLPRLQRDATAKIEELIDEPAPQDEGEASEGDSIDAENEDDSEGGSHGRPGDATDGRGSAS